MTRLLALIVLAVAMLASASAPSRAQPVEYVRVCNHHGTGGYYIPGTDTCLHTETGKTRVTTAWGIYEGRTLLREQIDKALEAMAMASALPTPRIEAGHSFALAGDWGHYEGFDALGLALAIRIEDGLQLSAAGAYGLEEGQLGARLSLNYSFSVVPIFREIEVGRAADAGPPLDAFEARWRLAAEGGVVFGGSVSQDGFWSPSGDFDGTMRFRDDDGAAYVGMSLGRDVDEQLAWRLAGRHTRLDQTGDWLSGSPDAEASARLTTLDLDALYALDEVSRFRLIAGVRGFLFEDRQDVDFLRTDNRATGVGPRIGLDTRIPFASSLAFVGDASATALFTNFDSSFGNKPPSARDYWYDDWIYALEARAGVTWSVSESFDVTAGYRVEHWTDLRQSFDQDRGDISSADMTLHGPYVSAAMTF